MSDTKTYTLRDVQLAKREGFLECFSWARKAWADDCEAEALAACKYPLPKVTRPRVVTRKIQGFTFDWRWVNDRLECAAVDGNDWEEYFGAIHSRGEWPTLLAILDDLRANPTEEVGA